ncbi:MAG: hypothetical protein AAGI38_20135 [Bacteroidota bacterium]
MNQLALSRARESRSAIEKMYIEMRHLFNCGGYQRLGMPGEVLTDAMLDLRPEIYGSLGDPDKVELDGLVYVIDRLPKGIESSRFIRLISEEGYRNSGFEVVVPASRRRNCYPVDNDNMLIEVTRGKSEIYDILTHLTFMFMEAEKIRKHALNDHDELTHDWRELKAIVKRNEPLSEEEREVGLTYLSAVLGRTFAETKNASERLNSHAEKNSGLFHVVYGMGKLAIERHKEERRTQISFSPTLRERIGHHIFGERWADQIKGQLLAHQLLDRPLHIISANMHSVMNCLYAYPALSNSFGKDITIEELALELRQSQNKPLMEKVRKFAHQKGAITLNEHAGTQIGVQIFDTAKLPHKKLSFELDMDEEYLRTEKPVIIVMDYAFGEQAFETMDELLKPYRLGGQTYPMPVASISIMGKAGILHGGKGDLMIPNAHIFEGTADNYPFENDFEIDDFQGEGVTVFEGPMISVMGTSLQNRDVLAYFRNSSWKAIGLEMEGAHYQKAIQAHTRIRNNISEDVVLRYAYYASDNPLITGSTLASGSLGEIGVKPTYLITRKILNKILQPASSNANIPVKEG